MEGGGEQKRRVVVVGGGPAGAHVAKSLQFDSDLVLIDAKEYFGITWADMRSMVEPSFAERTLVEHTEYLTSCTIITARAINVTETELLTDDGRGFPYDFLIIATGHDDDVPRNKNERIEQFEAENKKITAAGSVLIIGGGPTGVELAAEIATDYPDKKVTLVHKGSRLMEFIGPKASTKAFDWLTSKNVEVLFNQTVDLDSISDGTKEYKTSAGQTITADSHFVCIGRPLSTSWLKESIINDSLDEHGRVMVDENLRVKGQKNIFAIGDITDVQEIKQGYVAESHGAIVSKNLKLLIKDENASSLAAYKPASPLAIVSLGRKNAVAQLPFVTICGRLPGMIKSKDLFVGKTRKALGVDP